MLAEEGGSGVLRGCDRGLRIQIDLGVSSLQDVRVGAFCTCPSINEKANMQQRDSGPRRHARVRVHKGLRAHKYLPESFAEAKASQNA